jgi:hypothetical protein
MQQLADTSFGFDACTCFGPVRMQLHLNCRHLIAAPTGQPCRMCRKQPARGGGMGSAGAGGSSREGHRGLNP